VFAISVFYLRRRAGNLSNAGMSNKKKRKNKKRGKKIHLRNYFELTFALASTAVFCKRMRALFPIELLKNCLFAYWKSVPFRATPLVEL